MNESPNYLFKKAFRLMTNKIPVNPIKGQSLLIEHEGKKIQATHLAKIGHDFKVRLPTGKVHIIEPHNVFGSPIESAHPMTTAIGRAQALAMSSKIIPKV